MNNRTLIISLVVGTFAITSLVLYFYNAKSDAVKAQALTNVFTSVNSALTNVDKITGSVIKQSKPHQLLHNPNQLSHNLDMDGYGVSITVSDDNLGSSKLTYLHERAKMPEIEGVSVKNQAGFGVLYRVTEEIYQNSIANELMWKITNNLSVTSRVNYMMLDFDIKDQNLHPISELRRVENKMIAHPLSDVVTFSTDFMVNLLDLGFKIDYNHNLFNSNFNIGGSVEINLIRNLTNLSLSDIKVTESDNLDAVPTGISLSNGRLDHYSRIPKIVEDALDLLSREETLTKVMLSFSYGEDFIVGGLVFNEFDLLKINRDDSTMDTGLGVFASLNKGNFYGKVGYTYVSTAKFSNFPNIYKNGKNLIDLELGLKLSNFDISASYQGSFYFFSDSIDEDRLTLSIQFSI